MPRRFTSKYARSGQDRSCGQQEPLGTTTNQDVQQRARTINSTGSTTTTSATTTAGTTGTATTTGTTRTTGT
ncbi:hypothetical protein DEH18_28355 [Streptomyces sp. NHF165]|nr:hypothetical protein DEH18_28355 [Streptomyces sp. NHF165]